MRHHIRTSRLEPLASILDADNASAYQVAHAIRRVVERLLLFAVRRCTDKARLLRQDLQRVAARLLGRIRDVYGLAVMLRRGRR